MNETNAFVGYITNDGKILNAYNQHIGYTINEYDKVITTAKEYREVLYEKGILERPKTPEEINKEMREMIANLTGTISTLSEKINKLESGNNRPVLHLKEKDNGIK